MKILPSVAALFTLCSLVFAAPYSKIDKEKLFPEGKNGETTLDASEFKRSVDELCKFACTPILKFENETDATADRKDYQNLLIVKNALKSRLDALTAELKFYLIKLDAMGRAHFGLDVSEDDIAAGFEDIIAKEPQNAGFYKAYGEYSLNAGHPGRAEAALTRALELGDKSVNFALAALCLNKNDKDGAVRYLEEYVKFYPNEPQIYEFLNQLKEQR